LIQKMMQEGLWLLMIANPLLILQHRKIKEKFVFNSTDFDATGNRTAGGVGCAACHAAPEFD
jgi:hypothetical protein